MMYPLRVAGLVALLWACGSDSEAPPEMDASTAGTTAGTAGDGGNGGQAATGGSGGMSGTGGSAGTGGTGGSGATGVDAGMDAGVTTDMPCEPFGPSEGNVIDVDPSMSASLPEMVRNAVAGTTFRLADGTYTMTGDEAARRLQIRALGITLRSASGDAAAVIIDGEYTTQEILGVHAGDFTLAEVTLTRAVDHCVHVSPNDMGPNVLNSRFYGVHLTDCGEQFLKANPNGARTAFTDDGRVECSTFTMTDAGRPHVERTPGGCYTGGIDAHSARGWVVRANTFEGIYCAGEGLAEHAVHFWSGSRDTLVERNTILDCARGIGFGLVEDGATRPYADNPFPGRYVGHYHGVIRNNVIVATIPYYDTGIELDQARGAAVLHNTILETDSATGRFSSIDARFSNTQVTIRNNLVRRLTVRDNATTTSDHNLEDVPLSYVVDAENGDAHLTTEASMAIDQGIAHDDSGLDIDGTPHRRGAPDLGADER